MAELKDLETRGKELAERVGQEIKGSSSKPPSLNDGGSRFV